MPATAAHPARRDGINVARIAALVLVVFGHLLLAVIDRPAGEIRGANLLELHPGWAVLLAAAPMPVFFAAGGYANSRATVTSAAPRLAELAGIGAVVVSSWSIAVLVTIAVTGDAGIVGDGARLATQPLWFVAAYAPFAASGAWLARLGGRHPRVTIGACLVGLLGLDLLRFAGGAPRWIGWPGFALAWVVPWLAGGWWRHRVEHGGLAERRWGLGLAAGAVAVAVVLVRVFGYSPALIDAVPGARSNTSPPTLYTAVVGLAQVGVLLMCARWLDVIGARWRRMWARAGDAAVAVYAWHLTALALCAAVVAAGLPAPERLTWAWWLTRPLWWAAVLGVTLALVGATAAARRWARARRAEEPLPRASESRGWLGVAVLTAAGAGVGLEGPREAALAIAWSAAFIGAWWLLRSAGGPSGPGTPSLSGSPPGAGPPR